ncbi:hypothetical protein [Spirosoma endbachense]|uniref:hypothetical protein n=1 Tax=Spirosoma endbachense TaxID=2666025 RepID=UPI001391AA36|nr:hypothetical protein [Spirosoma endbachense]
MAKMQDIINARDLLRLEVEELDGGYTTVGKVMRKTTQFVNKTLGPNNIPRLETLEAIKDAVELAKRKQKARLAGLKA